MKKIMIVGIIVLIGSVMGAAFFALSLTGILPDHPKPVIIPGDIPNATFSDMDAPQEMNVSMIKVNEPLQPPATPAGCWQKIDAVPDHEAGDVFVINGTTNCRPGDRITVEIVSVSPGRASRDFISGDVEVRKLSTGSSGWSVTIDSLPFGQGQKMVSACGVGICGFQAFNITRHRDEPAKVME